MNLMDILGILIVFFLWRAYFEKIKFVTLKQKIFHINHSIGSGYNPGTDNLFIRLKKII